MVNFVILLECFGICLTVVALLLLLNGDGAREQKLLIIIMCGSLVQNIGYLLELTAPSVEAAITALLLPVSLYLLLPDSADEASKGAGHP